MDVDGVLTDGGVWWGPDGDEWKRFSFSDITGVALMRRAGFKLALISGEKSALVDRFAQKLRIDFVVKGCREKAAALTRFAEETGIALADICYMGDDLIDLPAIRIAGCSAAPANAARCAREASTLVMQHPGGNGAVRELAEMLLNAQQMNIEEVYVRP